MNSWFANEVRQHMVNSPSYDDYNISYGDVVNENQRYFVHLQCSVAGRTNEHCYISWPKDGHDEHQRNKRLETAKNNEIYETFTKRNV